MAGGLGPRTAPIGGSGRLCRAARRHARLILATDELRLPRLAHGAVGLQARPARHVCMQSGKGIGPLDGGSNEEGADIDVLAKMLSQQAAKLRASMSEEDVQELLAQEAREQVVFSQVAARMGPQLTAELEARVVAEVGDGGFTSDDFEILNRLGRISVAPASGPTAGSPPCTAVIAYVARYIARQAYALPVTTLIKEFLPVAKSVAYNELLLLQHLCGLPNDKYQAAVSRPNQPGPPVVPLLGYFLSAPSEDAAAESQHGGAPGAMQGGGLAEEEDSLWLVYKWEGMRPLNLYMDAGPPQPQHGFFKPKETAIAEAWARRMAMLRSLARGLLSAIDFIHSGDVVHGALSSGSVLMSTSTDLQHPDEDLVVKIDGFGFGKWFSASASRITLRPLQPSSSQATEYGPVMLDAGLEEGKRADLQAAALLLAEAFACGLADGPGGQMTATTARRLLFDFQENSMAFRDYCLKDPDGNFGRLVSFLDERQGAGWAFMDALMAGQHTGLELSQHAFLRPKP